MGSIFFHKSLSFVSTYPFLDLSFEGLCANFALMMLIPQQGMKDDLSPFLRQSELRSSKPHFPLWRLWCTGC